MADANKILSSAFLFQQILYVIFFQFRQVLLQVFHGIMQRPHSQMRVSFGHSQSAMPHKLLQRIQVGPPFGSLKGVKAFMFSYDVLVDAAVRAMGARSKPAADTSSISSSACFYWILGVIVTCLISF